MASIVNYVADGATNQFQIPFTYINQADVVVTVNGTAPTFTFINSTTINIAATPTSGAKVIIKRVTPLNALVDFTDGSTLFEADLDLAHQQNRLIAEESRDRADSAIATINANIDNIDTVAEIVGNVNIVAGNTTNVNSVAANMAEVLTADDNAATATTKANEASASASTASAQATVSTTKAGESSTSAAEALASKNAASASESASSTSETNAANSATSSSNSATASASSASSANSSQTVATTKAAEAVVSANNSAVSATNSANSATTATTKANEASASQVAASNSETNALSSKNAAASSATNAATSETNSASSATASANSSATATTKANEAAASATSSANSATASANSATAAAASAASITGAETNSANSATAAANSATAASASKDAALAALDNFDDRYLGVKSSNPSVDNDGNALVAGSLYFNSTDDTMKVYEGSAWVAAYASLSGAVLQANNLSDLTSASDARANLGLGTAATTASSTYATAAQGTLATNALPKAGGTMTGNLSFGDDDKALFGAGSDLQIYHDGNNSFIKDSGTGRLSIVTSQLQLTNSADSQVMIKATESNAVELYHSGAQKLATTSTGIDITGTVSADGLTTDTISNASGNLNISSTQSIATTFDSNSDQTNREFNIMHDTNTRVFTANESGDISFYEDTGTTAKFFWDSSAESLGLGTSSPSRVLHTSGDIVRFDNAGPSAILLLDTTNNEGFRLVTNRTSGAFSIEDMGTATSGAGTERMVIDSSGNLLKRNNGNIEVGGFGNGTDYGVILTPADGSGYWHMYNDAGGHLAFGNSNTIGSTERMRIDSSGRVGIGTTSPSRNLTVSSSTQTDLAIIAASGSSSQLCFGDGDDDNVGQIEYSHPTDSMRLYTQATERMRIDSSGNLLVGKTSTESMGSATSGHTFYQGGTARHTVNSGEVMNINRLNSDGSIIGLYKSGSNVGNIGVLNSNNLTISGTVADHGGLQFGTHCVIPMEANVDSDGTINLGSSNSRFKDGYFSGNLYGDGSNLTGVGGSTTAGAVGTYSMLYYGSYGYLPGHTTSGSNLDWGNTGNLGRYDGGTQPAGTWKLMACTGWYNGSPTGGTSFRVSLWLRIS